MRVEGQGNGRDVQPVGHGPDPGDQIGVTEVDTIEVADREDRSSNEVGDLPEAVDDDHQPRSSEFNSRRARNDAIQEGPGRPFGRDSHYRGRSTGGSMPGIWVVTIDPPGSSSETGPSGERSVIIGLTTERRVIGSFSISLEPSWSNRRERLPDRRWTGEVTEARSSRLPARS